MNETLQRSEDSKIIVSKILRGVDVTEVYSQPRIAAACMEVGLIGGSSLDLRTGWDLSKPVQQRKDSQVIMKESPKLLIGSPPCTLFSNLQNINLAFRGAQWEHEFYERRRKAEVHLKFCCKLYKLQQSLGRYYLHEHPSTATSWDVKCMKVMQESLGAIRVRADQCQYGLTTVKNGIEYPAKRPTDFLTNAEMVSKELMRRCPGNHIHAHLDEGRAKAAEVYPRGLIRAIITGLKNQIEHDKNPTIKSKPLSSIHCSRY